MDSIERTVSPAQMAVCKRFDVAPCAASPRQKAGIARNVTSGLQPVNGLRHLPEGDTSGWYIWAGEHLSDDPNFFVPVHIQHLDQWCPDVLPYLALPPGWRFLLGPNYEDVWHDPSLLAI